MNTYEQEYECTKCPWTTKRSETHLNPETDFQDFRNLVGIGLMSHHHNCPECGASVKKSTKKAA